MKVRGGFLLTCAAGALLLTGTTAAVRAADPDFPVKAAPVDESWWWHGDVEVRGRFFLNNPNRNGTVYTGQQSLAKFYEYRDLRPGAFSNIETSTGSRDGLYEIDFWAKNIGYEDQSYFLNASKAGVAYFTFGWDQTPHIYSTSAQTPYLGVGTNLLTLPAAILPKTAAGLVPFLQGPFDIGIRRDTASTTIRWTPTDAWDIRGDYSHMRREGTQIGGATGVIGDSGFGPAQVPVPVADTTQNFGVNGEYAGTSPWNQKFTAKVGYNGSQYNDDFSSYMVQSPTCLPGGAGCVSGASTYSPFANVSTPPSNQMNAVSGTVSAELPWDSRYTGTVNYTMMRQNAAFIPMTVNPAATAGALALPAASLNGEINTLLSNNVITTKINSELSAKTTYRYYNFDNETPELLFPSWVSYDHVTTATGLGSESAIRSMSISYTKQNLGEELVWRPNKEWSVGAAYGYERYSWQRESADVTNENSLKAYATYKPLSTVTVRGSAYFSDRRYDNYNYNAYVAAIQFPTATASQISGWFINPAYRVMMTDNRERWKFNAAVDWEMAPGLVLSPNAKVQDDNYGLNQANQLGLAESSMWNVGTDLSVVISPQATFTVGYLREYYDQKVYNLNATTSTTLPSNPANTMLTDDPTTVDTVMAFLRYAAIPGRLDTELRYTASHSIDYQRLYIASGAAPAGGQFPNVSDWFQRLDAMATYTFDPELVKSLGWTGNVKASLKYAWERNAVANWQNDTLWPYSPLVSTTAIWLGANNPNYNVHMLMGSVRFQW